MKDHTYNGLPTSQMSLEDIHNCLDHGIKIITHDVDGMSEGEAIYWVRLRLQVELIRRSLGLPIRP